MNTFALKLAYVGEPVYEPSAWFIPGADPALWLDEMLEWRAPLEKLRLYVLPNSVGDRRPSGVLAVPPAGVLVAATRAIPYGLLAGRLYIPADAELDPPLSEAELRKACVWQVAVLHPGVGLVGFEGHDALTVAALFHPPIRRDVAWDRAEPGIRLNAGLESVTPATPLTIDIILENGQEDIGAEPMDSLPSSPEEDRLPGPLGTWTRAKAARLAEFLIRHAPRGPTDGALIRLMKNWLTRQHALVGDGLQRVRHKELLRLMHLLAQDFDRGLRHAIPIENAGTRGQAKPAAHLPDRDPTFRLGDLRGSRPADSWQAPYEYVERLRNLYREAANRELALGRHRRAAFIYAKLLGDYHSAAAMLRTGQHYREAAVLYQDFARDGRMAAVCLEEGGLLGEAIKLYRRFGLLEKVGDLYECLDQHERAMLAYRVAAKRLRRSGDFLAAAVILEEKVKAPEDALHLLRSGWPASRQAIGCLRGVLRLLGSLGRHDEAQCLIADLTEHSPPPHDLKSVAEVLSAIAGGYPDAEVRSRSADAARVIIGSCLSTATGKERESVLASLRRLAPHDRLLTRDTQRFAARQMPTRPPRPAGNTSPGDAGCVAEFKLPVDIAWEVARACGECFFLAGPSPDGVSVVLLRGTWQGHQQVESWHCGCEVSGRILLDMVNHADRPVLLAMAGLSGSAQPTAGFTFSAAEGFARAVRIITPAWLEPATLALCHGEGAAVWSVRQQGSALVLKNQQAAGQLNSTRTIDLPGRTMQRALPVLAQSETLWIGIGNSLIESRGKDTVIHDLQGRIVALEGLRRGSFPLMLARTEANVRLFTNPGSISESQHAIGTGWENPVACLTTDGLLVVADHKGGSIYAALETRPRHLRNIEPSATPPVAVLRAGRMGRYAVITQGGLVRVHQLSLRC